VWGPGSTLGPEGCFFILCSPGSARESCPRDLLASRSQRRFFPHQGNHGTTLYYGVRRLHAPSRGLRASGGAGDPLRDTEWPWRLPTSRKSARLPVGRAVVHPHPSPEVETRAPPLPGPVLTLTTCAITS